VPTARLGFAGLLMGRQPIPLTPVSRFEDKKETARIEREKRGLMNLAYEPYIETPISNCLNWAQPVFFVILILGALALFLSLQGCSSHRTKAGYPAPIPGCVGAVAYVSDGCRVSEFPEYIEVDCPESTTKYLRCKNAQ
jgi:hypothetical protein